MPSFILCVRFRWIHSLANAEELVGSFYLNSAINDQENRWEEVELFNRWNFLTGSLWPSSTRHSPVLHFHTCRQRHCSSSQRLTLTFKVSWNWFAKHIAFKYWFWFKVINFLSTTVYYPFLQNFNVHAAAHNYQLLNSPPDTHILCLSSTTQWINEPCNDPVPKTPQTNTTAAAEVCEHVA